MQRIGLFLMLWLSLTFTGGAIADTLLIESVESAATVARPAHGTTMDGVLQKFGEPQQRLGPVGEPPITHWVYADFVVYFEYDRVIHSVVPHKK